MTIEEQAATLDRKDVVALLTSHQDLTARVAELTRQLEWFKQQLFGEKSERRLLDNDSRQLALGEWRSPEEPGKEITVAEHQRRSKPARSEETTEEEAVRFDDTVPVEEIRLPHPRIDDEHEIVSEKTTYRLAQRPVSYVVVKYVRPVVKRKADGVWTCPPAPPSVLGKSLADVSLLACMVVDKFRYHLPLYRQHQRMAAAGIHLARSTLTGWVHREGDLLEPIVNAQFESVLESRTLTMDETPIRAGIKSRGKMKTGYFWPIYGDRDEVVFPFAESRSDSVLEPLLVGYRGVLLSDGYGAYERYIAATEKNENRTIVQLVAHPKAVSEGRGDRAGSDGDRPGLHPRPL